MIEKFWIDLQHGTLPQLGYWNYLLLAILVAIEGPIATLLGAAAASAGLMRLPFVFLAASTGNLSADVAWYSLGYYGKVEWLLLHLGRYVGFRREHLEYLQKGMRNHAKKILFVGKLTASFMIPSLIAAGLSKVPIRKWLPTLLAGECVWTGTLVLLGFYATEAIKQVERGVEYIGIAGTAFFLLIAIFWARKAFKLSDKLLTNSSIIDDTTKK